MHLLLHLAVANASSHREAPMISGDPTADITDFYAFVDPNDSSKFVMIMNVIPLEEPGGGPNYHMFDNSVRYSMQCDNEGDARPDVRFEFHFDTSFNYPDDFLYNLGDISNPANVNHTQTFDVTMIRDGLASPLVTGGTVAPINVGVVSVPAGGYNPESSTAGTITMDNVYTDGTISAFAGPRQEGFYVDLERTFDLLNLGYVDNTNTLLGKNVHSIAIEVPSDWMTRDGAAPGANNSVVACWSTTERRANRTVRTDGTRPSSGRWVQVSRLGSPLVNEVVIPVSMKDRFNASSPMNDIQFLSYVTDPILPVYLEAVLGVPNPGSFDAGLGIGGREDLVLAFLTGHPALGTLPAGYALGGPIPNEPGKVFAAFEALRVNLSSASGFPNGRLPGDDVTDVALSAMAGLLIDGSTLSDGVGSAGLHYLSAFPFLGDPWSGDDHPAAYHDL